MSRRNYRRRNFCVACRSNFCDTTNGRACRGRQIERQMRRRNRKLATGTPRMKATFHYGHRPHPQCLAWWLIRWSPGDRQRFLEG